MFCLYLNVGRRGHPSKDGEEEGVCIGWVSQEYAIGPRTSMWLGPEASGEMGRVILKSLDFFIMAT